MGVLHWGQKDSARIVSHCYTVRRTYTSYCDSFTRNPTTGLPYHVKMQCPA